MAKNSRIEWTHHTFNPWWGCTKISPACKHCYAEAWAKRVGSKVWGARAARRFFGDTHWQQPLTWNADARTQGIRYRVFCASMADVFEDRSILDTWRTRLWDLIIATPSLDWLLLTKRPERIADCVPWKSDWPKNVWLGTTAESQEWAELRVPHLLKIPAAVRFLSCEPLLGAVDLAHWLRPRGDSSRIDWVIAGGESGGKARPTHPGWVRSLRDQCASAGVAFHFKQWGNWFPSESRISRRTSVLLADSRLGPATLVRMSKGQAGRLLDGRTWDEFPGAGVLAAAE